MSLEPGVNGEAASRRVHAGEEDDVVYVFETELGAVVPVLVVHPLSDQSVRLHRSVLIHLTTSFMSITSFVSQGLPRNVLTASLATDNILQHETGQLSKCNVVTLLSSISNSTAIIPRKFVIFTQKWF